jgi:pyruvate dehydrogenase (quinone)
VVVLNNGDLNMVSWELRALGGSPKLPQTQDVPPFDYVGYAELLGIPGIRIERPDGVQPALERAFAARHPILLDVHVDPAVLALPPHATFEQTKNLFEALAKGDPDRGSIVRQLLRSAGP